MESVVFVRIEARMCHKVSNFRLVHTCSAVAIRKMGVRPDSNGVGIHSAVCSSDENVIVN